MEVLGLEGMRTIVYEIDRLFRSKSPIKVLVSEKLVR